MLNRKLIYILVIFHILPPGSKTAGHKFLSKLVNQTRSSNSQTIKQNQIEADTKCKYKCIPAANELAPRFQARDQARFIDLGTNDTVESSEMEAPASKYTIFNLLSDDNDEDNDEEEEGEESVKEKREEEVEEENEDDDDDDDEEEEAQEKDDDYGDNDDDYIGFNLLNPEEEISPGKLEGTKGEELLKQYHRHRLRMHNLVFPLLLAYKLKFFTVIPLLLGSLVLLIGSTGIAGFFFALFAAALGIHVKGQQH